MENQYELLDSGNGRKLERFGSIVLSRPAAQAVWEPRNENLWARANASFDREGGLNWRGRETLPDSWVVAVNGIRMKLSATDFGHVGLFPETRDMWGWIRRVLGEAQRETGRPVSFLNLFAYSGAATLAAASAGAECCHVDSAKGMVDWARENAALNGLEHAPIRWIVDDVGKFLGRENRRGRSYDAVLLDPPSFGRGKRGELYKIENHLIKTLSQVRGVLSIAPLFVALTSHTPGFSPIVLRNVLAGVLDDGAFGPGSFDCGEMLLTGGDGVLPLPSGTWARWTGHAYPSAKD